MRAKRNFLEEIIPYVLIGVGALLVTLAARHKANECAQLPATASVKQDAS